MRALSFSTIILGGLAATAAADPATLAFDRATPPRHALVFTASLTAQDPASAPAVVPDAPRERATTVFGLPKNMGPIDRVARAAIGSALLGVGIWGLSTSGHLSNTTSGVLVGVSAIPFATAATGYCPLYHLFGVDYTF